MKWQVIFDPFNYMELIWALMYCGKVFMWATEHDDVIELNTLCKQLNEMEQYAHSGS